MTLSAQDNDDAQPTALTLEQLKIDFLNWRRDPGRPKQIPDALWDNVFSLLNHYSKSKVMGAAHISRVQLDTQLKRRMSLQRAQQSPSTTINPTPSFVKAILKTETSSTPNPASCHDVILTQTNGTTLPLSVRLVVA